MNILSKTREVMKRYSDMREEDSIRQCYLTSVRCVDENKAHYYAYCRTQTIVLGGDFYVSKRIFIRTVKNNAFFISIRYLTLSRN